MKREIHDKLDKVFEKKRQAETAAAAAKSAQEKRQEEAVLKFKEIGESMIRPTMQQFADYLGNKGHAAEILMEEEKYVGSGANRRLVAPSIKLLISPNSNAPQRSASYAQNPHFDVILEKSLSKVWFHESTMRASGSGHAGKCGEADLDKLTGDTLELQTYSGNFPISDHLDRAGMASPTRWSDDVEGAPPKPSCDDSLTFPRGDLD